MINNETPSPPSSATPGQVGIDINSHCLLAIPYLEWLNREQHRQLALCHPAPWSCHCLQVLRTWDGSMLVVLWLGVSRCDSSCFGTHHSGGESSHHSPPVIIPHVFSQQTPLVSRMGMLLSLLLAARSQSPRSAAAGTLHPSTNQASSARRGGACSTIALPLPCSSAHPLPEPISHGVEIFSYLQFLASGPRSRWTACGKKRRRLGWVCRH